jgi:hypothetical protein
VVLSMLTFAYIVAGAVGLLVWMSIKIYSENSRYAAELKFHLQQKTISSNLAKAQLSVVQTKFNDLTKKSNVNNNEELNKLKKETQEFKEKIDEISQNFSSELKFEKEKTEIALLNFNEMENLNKSLSNELNAYEDAQLLLKEEILKANDLHKSLQKDIETKEAKLVESHKEKKVLLTKLVGYESREELLQSKVSDLAKQIHNLETQNNNQGLIIENLQEKDYQKSQLTTELKESNQILNQKLAAESKKVSAHEKIDSINRREAYSEEAKKDFEKVLMKRVLKAYSVILRLEKKNLDLKNQLKENKSLYEKETKNNVIHFPNSENIRVQEINNTESRIHKVHNLIIDQQNRQSGRVESNELEFLKAKLDEARKSLYEIQSAQNMPNLRKSKIVA